ncbi:MAG: CfrBI family restriction endonuclease [bacterium]
MLINNAEKSTIYELIDRSVEILQQKRISKSERWLAQWILGLNDKAFQNILRDDPQGLNSYKQKYVDSCQEVISSFEDKHGSLSCVVKYGQNKKALLSWSLIAYLLNTIGAETLTIRGSAKSAYGKLFEKLVLGSLLHILGFKFVSSPEVENLKKIFWLSSRGERRESDATLIYGAGKGVRFDIGFIGRGNPEISLDKVSRFEREITLGRSRWYMATIILVDRIGERSRIETLAKSIGGNIIQMSMGYWLQEVAKVLKEALGYRHKLASMSHSRIGAFLAREIRKVPIERFVGLGAE